MANNLDIFLVATGETLSIGAKQVIQNTMDVYEGEIKRQDYEEYLPSTDGIFVDGEPATIENFWDPLLNRVRHDTIRSFLVMTQVYMNKQNATMSSPTPSKSLTPKK